MRNFFDGHLKTHEEYEMGKNSLSLTPHEMYEIEPLKTKILRPLKTYEEYEM